MTKEKVAYHTSSLEDRLADLEDQVARLKEAVALAGSPVMTVDQVADFLQVSPRTVYTLLKTGEIPAAKVSNQWRFAREAVTAWLNALSQSHLDDDQVAHNGSL